MAAGLLEPDIKRTVLGMAEIRKVFDISGIGPIAGCYVTEGSALASARADLVRNGVVIHTGEVAALRRFKDGVQEVKAGTECGVALTKKPDLREGDVIEFFKETKVERTL